MTWVKCEGSQALVNLDFCIRIALKIPRDSRGRKVGVIRVVAVGSDGGESSLQEFDLRAVGALEQAERLMQKLSTALAARDLHDWTDAAR